MVECPQKQNDRRRTFCHPYCPAKPVFELKESFMEAIYIYNLEEIRLKTAKLE